MPKRNLRKTLLSLHGEGFEWLRRQSERTGLSRSEIVRRLLDAARTSPAGGCPVAAPETPLEPTNSLKPTTDPKNGGNGQSETGLWWVTGGGE